MRHISRRFATRRQEVIYLLWMAFLLVFILPALVLVFLLYQMARAGATEVVAYLFGALTLGLVGFALLRSELLAMFPTERRRDLPSPAAGEGDHAPPVNRLEGIADHFDELLENFHDATDRLTRQILQLTTLNEISEFASRITNLNEMLDRALVRAMKVVNAEIGSIMRLVDDGKSLELIAAYGLEVDAGVGTRVPLEDSLARVAVHEGRAVVVSDITRDPRFQRFNDPKYGSPSFLCVPLRARGEIIGVFNLSKKADGGPFREEDVKFLNTAFGQIGFALENARLYEQAQHGYQQLKGLNQRLKEYAGDLEKEVEERTRELQETNARMRTEMDKVVEADRVKSDFIASVSHELRTPLNAVLGFSSLILSGQEGDIPDKVRGDLEMVHQAGQRLLRIVSNILDTSRFDTGNFAVERRPVSLSQILQDVEREARNLDWQPGVELRLDLPDDLHLVSADRPKLVSGLMHIIDNAVKFTTQGAVTLKIRQRANEAVVEVIDSGPGIDERDLPFIFDKFWQRPNQRGMGGTGLGLTLAKRIVEAHGGRIEAYSRLGEGTIITVTLPTM
jgi:two-component system sensor histidine kinase/response regulator